MANRFLYPFVMVQEENASMVLAANIKRLQDANPGLDSSTKLGKRAGIGQRTAARVMAGGQVSTGLDVIESIAKAFDLEVWQILVPNLDPSNLPVICNPNGREKAFYEKLMELAKTEFLSGGTK